MKLWPFSQRTHVEPQHFFPRNIPLSKPSGQSVTEFLIVGRDDLESVSKVMSIFADRRINVLASYFESRDEAHNFILTFFAEVDDVESQIEILEKEISSLSFVKQVQSVKMKDRVYDQYLFPITATGSTRVIIMRADPLLNIEKQLFDRMGSAATSIMYEEGRAYARQTTAQMLTISPNMDRDELLENSLDGLRAFGWGIFRYRKSGEVFEITATDLPFSDPRDAVRSRFVHGIVAGMIETMYGIRLRVASSNYDEADRKLSLRFEKVE